MNKFFIFAENVFVVLSLLLFTNALIPMLYEIRTGNHAVNSLEGNSDVIASFFIIYIITLFLVFLRWKKFIRVVTERKLLLVLIGIALASVFWSVSPELTLRRSFALVGTTLFGFYLATRYSLKEQFRLLTWALGIAMVLSVLLALLLPSYGIHQGGDFPGSWKGIYTHKNTLGFNMGFSVCVFALLAFWGGKYRLLGWVGFILAAILLLLSTSKTPLLCALTVLALLPLYSILRWRYTLSFFFFAIAVMINVIFSTLLLNNAESILGAFGRDLTLTGRTQLWTVVVGMIQKRPWLGYGYTAFWLGWEGESQHVWTAITWHPDYSHNGYLELALQLGLLGIVVFGIDFLFCFIRALTVAGVSKTAAEMFPLAFLTFFLPFSISESIILKQNSIFWVLYVSLTLSMFLKPIRVKI